MELLLLLAAVGAVLAVFGCLSCPLPPPVLGPARCGGCGDALRWASRVAQWPTCTACRAQQHEAQRRNLQPVWVQAVRATQRKGLTGADFRTTVGLELFLADMDQRRAADHRRSA